MYETNAKGVYITSDRKVKDYDALVKAVDVVFIRAAYVPVQKWSDGSYYNNTDTAKTDDDLLREDASYKLHFTKVREAASRLKRNTKIITVSEFNPAYGKDYLYNVKFQAQQLKRIVAGAGNFVGDAICSQITTSKWIENGKVVSITSSNFKLAVSRFFADAYAEFGNKLTIMGWSQSSVLKNITFASDFTTWLDFANKGEPTWPFGFTYLPTSWKAVWYNAVEDILDSIALAPILTSAEADQLKIGSYTGWLSKNQAGNASNHGFWGLYGTKVPYIVDVAGNPVMIEPIIFDCDMKTLCDFMIWSFDPPVVVNPGGDSGTGTPCEVTKADFDAMIDRVEKLELIISRVQEAFINSLTNS